jgi:putative copper resistance protein D
MAAGHTDGQLYYWISEGFQGTAMPAFKDTLSDEERWNAVNFIRTFALRDR